MLDVRTHLASESLDPPIDILGGVLKFGGHLFCLVKEGHLVGPGSRPRIGKKDVLLTDGRRRQLALVRDCRRPGRPVRHRIGSKDL